LSRKAIEKAEMANISIMEAGIIFHSLRKSRFIIRIGLC
jgi:hypothetical protein